MVTIDRTNGLGNNVDRLASTTVGKGVGSAGASFDNVLMDRLQQAAKAELERTQGGTNGAQTAQPGGGTQATGEQSPAAGTGSVAGNPDMEKQKARLKAMCQEFEAVFLQQMLKGMRNTVMKSDLVPESPGRDIWESMRDEEYAKTMAKSNQVGLSTLLYNQLSRTLEGTTAPPATAATGPVEASKKDSET
ncbi:rod-binding protein [Heliophilum fasciatum]|uniref:Rod binding protein n=1 Tax=Heliophilum fasciatum TaxID=35700 RepID=A0A4V2SWU7_9FIRM|nr:rod-binding protein [Heliophilum fasciatum]MCW2278351.1 hypothetical protein [Heliophilum fasciatum]TCP63776.1 rod binding protein [Heliophilum fasciatum]